MPNDKDTLEEIKKALDAATDEPLYADPDIWPGNDNLSHWVNTHWDGIGAYVKYEDAYLAANAPEWLRYLLQKIDQKQEEIERIAAQRDRYYEGHKYAEGAARGIAQLRSELQQSREENDRLNKLYKDSQDVSDQLYQQVRTLDGDNERLRGELDDLNERIEIQKAEIHKWKEATKEEFSCRYAAENKLEQAKTERDKYQSALHAEQKENVRLMEELAAKNKVLEWYGKPQHYYNWPSPLFATDQGQRARTILQRYERGDNTDGDDGKAPSDLG